MDQTDKNSFSGRVIREYLCRKCGHTDWEDDGVALWQVLHDAREEDEAEAAARRVAATGLESPGSAVAQQPEPKRSRWQRFADLFRWKG
jgi:hypothetical protein